MTSTRIFYRTVFTFEILSEEPYPDEFSLEQVQYDTTEGHCSGTFLSMQINLEIDAQECARLLITQGSDPEFFTLTEEGEDAE